MDEYKMNEGRKSGYHFIFSDRETGEILMEGDVTGGNKTDCKKHAITKFGISRYGMGDKVKLYMKANESITSEAQKRAQKKYDEANKDKFRMVHLKLNRKTDAEIIDKLESVDSIQGYIKALIKTDIR